MAKSYLISLMRYVFLRAFYIFELAKRYGNIPLLLWTYEPEEINLVEPSSFDAVIDFIVTECDRIIADNGLPVDHRDYRGYRSCDEGAVLALKSRALLYAASRSITQAESLQNGRRQRKPRLL